MTTQPTPTAALNLPISLLVCPGRQLLVPSPFPPAPVTFVGWGGIRGPDEWSDDPKVRLAAIRDVLLGVSRSATVPADHRIVIGCENRTRWMKGNSKRGTYIDAMLRAIIAGTQALHNTEVAFSGPEHAVCGDFLTPMLGRYLYVLNKKEQRGRMPFISPLYGGTVAQVARSLRVIAAGPGLSRRVMLWMQETDPAAQQGVIDFGLKVDQEYGRIR